MSDQQKSSLEAIMAQRDAIQDQNDKQAEAIKAKAPEGDTKGEALKDLEAKNEELQKENDMLSEFMNKPDTSNMPPDEKAAQREENAIRKNPFKNLGHMCAALYEEKDKGASTELQKWRSEVKATLTVGAAESAGTLVPTEYVADALERISAVNPVLTNATIVPMQYDKVEIPFINGFDESQGKVMGNGQFFWEGESETFTASNFETGGVELNLKQSIGAVRVSRNLLKFSAISIEAIIGRMFDKGMSKAIIRGGVRGTGAKQPKGVLTPGGHKVTVPKAQGQNPDTFVLDNLADMVARLYSDDDDIGAGTWFSNRTVLPQLIKLSLTVGAGGSGVFIVNQGVQAKPTYSLLGIPLSWSSQMSKVGDVGDIALIDWSQYLIGQPAGGPGAESEVSIHLYFDSADSVFRVIFDMDGQPWWPENFKPEFGDSQAPVVELAARD